jgi:hypothetical protein
MKWPFGRSKQKPLALGVVQGDAVVETTPQQSHDAVQWDNALNYPRKQGVEWYKRARQIRRDPTVKLVREFAVAPLMASPWSYEEQPGAPEGSAEFVKSQIDKHRLKLLRTSVFGCIDYGWQSFEKVWKDCPDGSWGYAYFKPLLPDITQILVDPSNGRFAGLRQYPFAVNWSSAPMMEPGKFIYMDKSESALVSLDPEGTQWYGEPVLIALESVIDDAAWVAKSSRKYDAKVAGSHWVIYYPIGETKFKGVKTDNGEIARTLIREIEAVGGLAIPRSVVAAMDTITKEASGNEALMWKVDLLTDKGSGQTSFSERHKYFDVLKVRAFGFPERAMLEGQFGTKAEAEAHADLAILNMDAKHRMYCEQYDEHLVDDLLVTNYGVGCECMVKIKPSPLADTAKAFLRDMYKVILANPEGFVMEAQSVDMRVVREKLGVPELNVQYAYEDDLAALDDLAAPLIEPQQPEEPVYDDNVQYQ